MGYRGHDPVVTYGFLFGCLAPTSCFASAASCYSLLVLLVGGPPAMARVRLLLLCWLPSCFMMVVPSVVSVVSAVVASLL